MLCCLSVLVDGRAYSDPFSGPQLPSFSSFHFPTFGFPTVLQGVPTFLAKILLQGGFVSQLDSSKAKVEHFGDGNGLFPGLSL